MCDACQGAKLEKTGDLQAPRYFIHPYFDTFTIPQIVNLTIAPPFNTPTFTLEPHPQLTAAESMLVTTHLRELEIAKRYIRFFRNEHRRLLKNVRGLRNSGQDVGATLAVFRAGAAIPTQNSWQHIFYTGVVENLDLLDYLINDDLPALP